jgi:hypothetical protein
MANGRIRRSARRGIAAAVLGWLCVAVASVVLAPGAGAAPNATVTIDDVTPPLVSVDPGGRVTFVNAIKPDTARVSIPVVGSVQATVYRDVAVTFFGEKRSLASGASTAWTFPQTTNGSITYTFRIVPQSGLPAEVADQVVTAVRATLDDGGAPVTVPYVVQTIVPDLPNAPSVSVPELPAIEVPDPIGEQPPAAPLPGGGDDGDGGGDTGGNTGAGTDLPESIDGEGYTYGNGAAPQGEATNALTARAFDPARFPSVSSADRSAGGSGSGGGGVAGGYDGASVPVFGQLAGLDGTDLDQESAGEELATSGAAAQTLPVAALAAVVALATVTAALVRTHQAQRTSKR